MRSLLFLGNIGMGEILVVALVVLLFFGGKKIPELMRGLGKGVRSFKDGMNDIEKELNVLDEPKKEAKPKKAETAAATTAAAGAEAGSEASAATSAESDASAVGSSAEADETADGGSK